MVAEASHTDNILEETKNQCIPSFTQTLSEQNLDLVRDTTTTLQINVGLMCNQVCTHCHLDAGPMRDEMMNRQTMDQVIDFASRNRFETIDITGGAPELHPDLIYFIEKLFPLDTTLILRSNLSALYEKEDALIDALKKHKVTIVTSFPSLNEAQADAMRGKGIFETSIHALKSLNTHGYGIPESGLTLNLVVNPAGSFLSPAQDGLEKRFRKVLEERWGVYFNSLFSFANVPLGRFKKWLMSSGNYDKYMKKLASSFNPEAVAGLMCRKLVSVSWDGYLFDCDFNQAAGLFLGDRKTHVSDMSASPKHGTPIAIDDHCYTCTAGAGFT